LLALPGFSIKVCFGELLLNLPSEKISAETEDTGILITFTISRLCPGTVGAVHDEADTDAQGCLAGLPTVQSL
jgi:hypothetical protein